MPDPTRLVVGPGEGDNVEFGEILTRYRLAAGLSRAESAAKLELSSEYVRLIERGRRTPSLGMMPKLLSIYHIDFQLEIDKVIFDRYSVEFTSRIREARYKKKEIEKPNRDVRLGQIVRLLAVADDETLQDIHKRLRRAS